MHTGLGCVPPTPDICCCQWTSWSQHPWGNAAGNQGDAGKPSAQGRNTAALTVIAVVVRQLGGGRTLAEGELELVQPRC